MQRVARSVWSHDSGKMTNRFVVASLIRCDVVRSGNTPPLAALLTMLTTIFLALLSQMLSEVGPIMLVLEGGYNLSATAASTEQCMRVLLGEAPIPLTEGLSTSKQGRRAMLETLQAHAEYWPSAREKLSEAQLLEPSQAVQS